MSRAQAFSVSACVVVCIFVYATDCCRVRALLCCCSSTDVTDDQLDCACAACMSVQFHAFSYVYVCALCSTISKSSRFSVHASAFSLVRATALCVCACVRACVRACACVHSCFASA